MLYDTGILLLLKSNKKNGFRRVLVVMVLQGIKVCEICVILLHKNTINYFTFFI